MAIKIKYRDPKSTDFSSTDIIINVNEGSLFYKSNKGVHKITPISTVASPAAVAAGMANIQQIENAKFAEGGDFITAGKRLIMVGDNPGGRERVQITPLSSPNISGTQPGLTLNISAPLVDETVIDTIIPAIEKAQRLNLA